jgi:ABC-2 type transport system permease protein
MWSDVRAELVKQARRPADWLLLAVALVLSLTFGYVVPYAGYVSGSPVGGRGIVTMLPREFVGTALGGLPIFIGALGLIFGVLVAGGEYGWGTWKSVLSQRPSRVTVYSAKLVAVATGVLVLVVALFVVAAVASTVVAGLVGAPLTWPGALDVLRGLAAGCLIGMMWGSLGVVLAIALRGTALPIGLGLVWMLAVQNLLASVAAPLLTWVAQMQKGLPGPNAGALVAALGTAPGTPGVDAIVGSGQAVLVVAVYLAAFCVTGGLLFHRRDIA